MSITDCPAPTVGASHEVVRYEIDDLFVVSPPQMASLYVDVWAPIIPDTPYQRVLDISVEAPHPWSISHDIEFGNRILHGRFRTDSLGPLEFRLSYGIERLPVRHMLRSACTRPLEAPALFERSLRPEQFIEVNEKTRALASGIVGSERNPLEQARRIYGYVTEHMSYDAANQSWVGSSEHALVCSAGNCNDIHALFISLARSVGIPARLVLGQAFEPPPPGQKACELCGYHCWAEFFAPGLGWVPVDASCACKYGRHELFGDLEMNHVAWSVGRDILFVPPQRGARVLFFAGPYAEIDGQAHRSVERRIAFTRL